MKQSPWGTVQQEEKHQRGVTWVSTAGHGGYMISLGFAKKFLSEPAQAKGLRYGGYLCYEEDCLWAIVEFELMYVTTPQRQETIYTSLSRWNTDYLLARGLAPFHEQYECWLDSRESDRRRAAKDPNLVVAALQFTPGVVKVWTADEKEHFVADISYSDRANHKFNLDKMVQV